MAECSFGSDCMPRSAGSCLFVLAITSTRADFNANVGPLAGHNDDAPKHNSSGNSNQES